MNIKQIVTNDWTMDEVGTILVCADAELELRDGGDKRFEELRQIIAWCNLHLDALDCGLSWAA